MILTSDTLIVLTGIWGGIGILAWAVSGNDDDFGLGFGASNILGALLLVGWAIALHLRWI